MDHDFFGIPGYRPTWIDDTSAFLDAHAATLDALVGRTIESIHVLWDLKHDNHCREGPVVVALDRGEPLEVCAHKLDELSLTRGSIDLSQGVRWDWDDGPWHFAWRADPLPELGIVLGQRIRAVEVLESQAMLNGVEGWLLGGIELVTAAGGLSIFNGLDDTRVVLSASDEGVRRVPRAGREG